MKHRAMPLAQVLDVSIDVDYSWFLMLLLLTSLLATFQYPTKFQGLPVVHYWLMGAATTLFLFASVLLHELGHVIVALRHKVPLHGITLSVFGGVIRGSAEPSSTVAEFRIALAGPAVSFALAAFFGFFCREPLPTARPWGCWPEPCPISTVRWPFSV
jgi:Zn-dependent protease